MTSAFSMVSTQIRVYYIFANIIWISLWFVICYIGSCVYFYEYLNEKWKKKQNQFSSRLFVFSNFSLFLKKMVMQIGNVWLFDLNEQHIRFFPLSSVCIHYSIAFNEHRFTMCDGKERERDTTERLNNTKLTRRDPVSCVWCILHRNTWSHSFKIRLSIHYENRTNEITTKLFIIRRKYRPDSLESFELKSWIFKFQKATTRQILYCF